MNNRRRKPPSLQNATSSWPQASRLLQSTSTGDWFATDEHEPVKHDASRLQGHFEALVPFGYENDCGGFGDVVLDVSARKLTVERNDRFEDYTTTTYEV
jgi:hypothetical protein